MPAPAIAAILARLLPAIEGMAASGGGTAASLSGGAAAEGGLGGMLGRIFSGTKAFGSEAELGGALRQISDLKSTIDAAQAAMSHNSDQQEQVSQKARDDERQYMFSDPKHTEQLAELSRQQQAQRESMLAAQRQMNGLHQRAEMTTNPQAARAESLQRAGAIIGGGALAYQAARQFGPTIINHLPGVQASKNLGQAGTNLGSFAAGPVNSAIAGDMWQTGKDTAKSALSLSPTRVLETMSRLPDKITRWSEALVESQRHISRYNGMLARTFAEHERRGIIRGIESGNRTGGATSELSRSLDDLYDQLQPIKDNVTVVLARGLTEGVKILSSILKHIAEFKPYLDGMAARFLGMSEQQYKDFLESFAALARAQQRTAGMPIGKALEEALNRDKSKRIGTANR